MGREVLSKVRYIHENGKKDLADNKYLPNNAYLVEYKVEGETRYDVVQSVKVVDIFDEFYDKYKKDLINITQSSGDVNPKLWNGKTDGS
tara:strand:- start:452 stop:718 length:267 start_codon:yes stop_codon:yes gene_type:complete